MRAADKRVAKLERMTRRAYVDDNHKVFCITYDNINLTHKPLVGGAKDFMDLRVQLLNEGYRECARTAFILLVSSS